MYKSIILCLFILCLSVPDPAHAQRHLSGQRGLQVTAGTVGSLNPEKGFYAGAAFSTYKGNGNHWVLGGEYLEKRHPYGDMTVPQAQMTAEAGYYLNFLSDGSKTVFFSLGLSALAGYETVNWGDRLLPDGATVNNGDAFLYGGALTLEVEIFIADRIILLVNVRERALGGSSAGLLHTQPGIGLKFMLNR
ncbi:MAG: conjugal transfer protein TraO [Tannerella sp.]|nr:conjugal transfer protein TraO [Tannerella sp.]